MKSWNVGVASCAFRLKMLASARRSAGINFAFFIIRIIGFGFENFFIWS
jgi:hypothetical protein